MKESELGQGELARAVVETVRSPLLVLDGELAVVSANRAFGLTFQIDPHTIQDQSLFEIQDRRWDVPELRMLLERVLAERSEVLDFEIRTATAADVRVVLLNARQLQLEDAKRQLILLSLEDRTERDSLERELRRHGRELERSNQELQDFAHAASHDLQEPLRKIRLYADQVPVLIGPDIDPKAALYLQRMSEAVKRMRTRVDDLLQLARVSRTPPKRVRTSLRFPIEQAMKDLAVAWKETGATIEVRELGEAEIDPEQMRMLFQNLIGNALKFVPPGQKPIVRIFSLDEDSPPLERHAAARVGIERGDLLRIVVEDEGIGFENEYEDRIFQPFQRLHSRTEYEGSGVGLAVCRRIMEHHHGSIRAQGKPGKGARFVIELPTTAPEDPP